VSAALASQAPPLPSPAAGGPGCTLDGGDKWVEVLSRRAAPELVVFANLLSHGECDALIEAARPRLGRSLTVDVRTGGEERHADRTSDGMFFERNESELVWRIENRIARLLRWPARMGEGLQVLRYRPGGRYLPHHDYFDPAEAGTPALLARGGQRVATLIMYLAAPERGGATVFPELGVEVIPQRGQAVFFSYAQALPQTLTLHGGDKVIAGEKWIATKWLRERDFG
jgi:prolyl 4-hydroxylase